MKIPANRRVYFDLPRDIPDGAAEFKLIITPFHALDTAPQAEPEERVNPLFRHRKFDPVKAEEARKHLCGMCKTDGHEVDRFMAEKATEKDLEV